MRVVCVAGARPNFMKVAPVLVALDEAGADTVLVHTGQHYDEAMSQVFFEELDIRKPDEYLGVGSGSHAEQTARVMTSFEGLLGTLAADVVVVVGDVNSTLACSIVAAKAGLLVAHVEAGLRSRDWGMPEEINRVVTDRVSDYLFAPVGRRGRQPPRPRGTAQTRSISSATSWSTRCCATSNGRRPAAFRPSSACARAATHC